MEWKLINLRVPLDVLARIDGEAHRRKLTRTAYIMDRCDPGDGLTFEQAATAVIASHLAAPFAPVERKQSAAVARAFAKLSNPAAAKLAAAAKPALSPPSVPYGSRLKGSKK